MTIDRHRLAELIAQEERRFVANHPRSLELFARAKRSLVSGVPMNWMTRWAGGFPVFVDYAHGARFEDVRAGELE